VSGKRDVLKSWDALQGVHTTARVTRANCQKTAACVEGGEGREGREGGRGGREGREGGKCTKGCQLSHSGNSMTNWTRDSCTFAYYNGIDYTHQAQEHNSAQSKPLKMSGHTFY
jgi:hypothetical protein